jgi:hypothetical protein
VKLSARILALALLLPSCVLAQNKELSLDELGFARDQVQGSDRDQALLDKRSGMLKIHQELGLLNIVPLLATLYTAPGDKSHQNARNIHAALGLTTASLFAATAYYAIAAPKPAGTVDKGSIRWHKKFAMVAGVGMILTPILGSVAYDQSSKGETVHGAARFHGTAAGITALSYAGAVLSVSIKF